MHLQLLELHVIEAGMPMEPFTGSARNVPVHSTLPRSAVGILLPFSSTQHQQSLQRCCIVFSEAASVQVLNARLKEAGMPLEPYSGYLDLRRYGTVPHAGFGLGFERLVLFATGVDNIREAIPFPRWPGHADF